MNFPWGHDRPINLASNHTKQEFGGRLQKVTIDAGFTCPNRDGSKSTGGCAFCNNNAFNPSYCESTKSITEQINQGISFHKKRYRKATQYAAYFQAYSNTYAPVEVLRGRYYEALNHPDIIGLYIGTRPDCVDAEIFDLLEEINKNFYLIIEFGIESVYEDTLLHINRGHSFLKAKWAVHEAHRRGIKVGAHFIFGLPGETKQMMMDSAAEICKLPLHSIKFHQLQIVRNTKIGDEYLKNPELFRQFELEEYIVFISEYLTHIPSDIIIERLAGETQPDYNLASKWNMRYDQVLQHIEKYMEDKGLWQGKNVESR